MHFHDINVSERTHIDYCYPIIYNAFYGQYLPGLSFDPKNSRDPSMNQPLGIMLGKLDDLSNESLFPKNRSIL